ncbi:D-lactaldehyde dehydrogenase [Mycena polygramma]|nr:D-lactaldehyde dehydrogenase [Mycena polygramma]
MPAITSGKVLVSGANGYIAVWVVRTLLENGFSVRGAVRFADKGTHLTELFAPYGDKFELVVVPDITKEGAFDEAVKGVDAIEHTASPFHFQADDPAELLEPAIKGTVGILESARKYGTSVKRVVVTSSCAAVMNISKEEKPQVLSELDWNDQAVEEVEKEGREATAAAKYRASKTLAERAAWNFVKKYQGEIAWDLSVMNPPLVLGPILHAVSSPAELNTSCLSMYNAFTKPDGAIDGGNWVDVRDLASAHVLALQTEAAGGERIIIAAGAFKWQEWLIEVPQPSKYNKPTPTAKGAETTHLLQYDNTKSTKLLGLGYKTIKDTLPDVLADWEARGW